MKLKELLDEWMEQYQKDHVKEQTYLRYQCTIKNNISIEFGNRDINEIKRKDIQLYINDLKKKISRKTHIELSSVSINITLTILKLVFDYAVDFDLLEDNPCRRVRGASTKRVMKVNAFTKEEQKTIEEYIESLHNNEYFGIILCLYTGLRIGELMALNWSDINFDTGILSVNKTIYNTLENGEWKYVVSIPKTRTSFREIPLPDFLLTLLKKQKEQSISNNVISKNNGDFLSPRLYRWRFNALLKKNKLRVLTFHALRHTFATRAIESGMDVRTLAEIMGHANVAITLNLYAHSMIEHKKKMMNNISRVIQIIYEN